MNNQIRRNNIRIAAFTCMVPILLLGPERARAATNPYPAMAPLSQYLMPDEKSEIALARSAAPASISDGAEVMVVDPIDEKQALYDTIVERMGRKEES